MRVFFLLLLSLSAVTETEAFILGIFEGILDIFKDIFSWGITAFNGFVDAGFKIGSTVIGAVVDPFGWWTPSADEHGHNTEPNKVQKCPAVADILFVFDTSGSISTSEFDKAKLFANRLSQHFVISDNDVRFSAISFGEKVQKAFDFKTYSDHSKLNMGVALIPYVGGYTKTYLALEQIVQQNAFSRANGARDGSSKIVIVITDGSSDDFLRTNSAASNLQKISHVICVGIGAGLGVELHNIASGWGNVFTADSYSNLVRIEQRVARRLCEIPEADGNIPSTGSGGGGSKCQDGFKKNPNKPNSCKDVNECAEGSHKCQQTCVNMVGSYRCTCKGGYVIDPKDTSKCKSIDVCNALVDIIVVLDASGSIGSHNFEVQQTFVAKLVHHFKYGSNGALFGAVLFATNVQKLFDLKTYASSRTDLTKALNSAEYIEGGTNTHLALQYVSENRMLSSASGGRNNAKDVVLIITDGDASNDAAAEAAAKVLKSQGAEIFALGIGEQVNLENLLRYASNPKNVLGSVDFELLDYVEESLATTICSRAEY